MNKKTRLIILIILALLIAVILSIGITRAFLKPKEPDAKITEVSLSSCTKIKLKGSNSINLSNSYPMSRNRGFQTTPYTFTVTSYCDSYVGINIYLATLNTNTLSASSIHYIITKKDSKDVLAEGSLSEDVSSTFSETDITEVNVGLNGTYGAIYKLYNAGIPYNGSSSYDLYLYIGESVTDSQGATFVAAVAVKSYERDAYYHESCDESLLACKVAKNYTGVQGENNIYYHDSELANGAKDNSYRYAGHPSYYSCTYDGNDVENFISGNTDDTLSENCSEIYKVVTSDGTVTYFDKSFEQYYYNTTSVEWDSNNNLCITVSGSADVYDFYGNEISQDMCNGIAYLDAEEDYFMVGITKVGEGTKTLVSEAQDGVNNYVCFGSDAETCPNDNLYKIIGVIDGKVKLIKATSLGSMAWDSNDSNTWSTSSLNTYLNGTYLNTFSEDWQAKIATTTWKVGGISSSSVTAATMYTNEMNSTTSGTDGLTEYSSKVALMYAHDYGFAASPTAWTTTLFNYDENDSAGTSITTNDWLYLGSDEWIVSRTSSSSPFSYLVISFGFVNHHYVTHSSAVRPVFYLISLATYSSGEGTSDNPYRLG